MEITELNKNWKIRFGAIFTGQAISLVGSSLTQFVLMWWITDITGSIAALATAGMVALLPQAILSPLGGILADRYSRRAIMIISDTVSALCMVVLIVLFLTDSIEMWHAYVMMAIRGAMQAFQSPASAASVAMLVPKSFLTRAAGFNQTLQGFTMVASAPLGALAISIMPIGWALSIDIFTALLGMLPLFVYAIPQIKVDRTIGKLGDFWKELQEGVLLVWNDKGLRKLYILLGCVVLIISPSWVLLPLLIKQYFGGGASDVAIMEGIGGIGMAAGGMIVAIIAPKRKMIWIIWGFALSCFTLALTALTPTNAFGIAVVFWTLSWITFIIGNAPVTALLQTSIPNQFQGRILSLLNTIMGLAAPIGLAIMTPVGEVIGVRWLFITLGTLGGLVSLLGLASSSLKKMDEQ